MDCSLCSFRSLSPRLSSVQQRAHLCHAFWHGDQVLQWPRTPLPHEEGSSAAVEEHTGERGIVSYLANFGYCVSQVLLAGIYISLFYNMSSPLLQFTLGGFEQLQTIKVRKREQLRLPPLPEDSIRVIRSMRAASPPASASDLIEQQQKRARREHKVTSTVPE